jgi:hypothetical protein
MVLKQLTMNATLGKGYYSATLGGGSPNPPPLYLDAGTYTAMGPGGADPGAFLASLNLPPPLIWTNMSSISTIVRANGQNVTWTGGIRMAP